MSSYSWPPSDGSGGVPIYATFAAFPSGSVSGDLAVAADTGNLYEWSGSAWRAIATPSSVNAITALTGDGTATGPGSVPLTLATVNANPGVWGTASQTPIFSVNGKGLITAVAELNILIVESQVTNLVSDLAGKQPTGSYITALTGDATASGPGSVAITLATVNGNVGTFGTATQTSTLTVNAKGLVTAAANTSIQIAESQVTNLVSDLAGKQATGNYITALTGDVTATGPGSVASTLATVNGNVGSFGSLTSIPSFTVNAKGLITAASGNTIVQPTVQRFLSGTGTYTTPAGAKSIIVQTIGGGGGGGGSGTVGGGTGVTGGNTTFGTTLIVASGGVGGVFGIGTAPGAGGAATAGAATTIIAMAGNAGQGAGGAATAVFVMGGEGGPGVFGGSGSSSSAGTGTAPQANSGAGGAGAGANGVLNGNGGAGGGAGGYVKARITSPLASYAYAVGAKGTGGTLGTNGFAGTDGGSGIIIVNEYYV